MAKYITNLNNLDVKKTKKSLLSNKIVIIKNQKKKYFK